ncbi:hypothetical protein RN001_010983 [Aquatica leii]|uniref:Complex III subunit 9 n=1 Tax=Aquatica leii TaxID=1421715 RepID=A0AAN7SET2_9COLE|nr:hypothetical protein RN001_010983 [Aquatica leii]
MSLATTINNLLFKRTSTFLLTVAACTFFFERTFDGSTEYLFEKLNEGKLWKHIKQNYEK